MGAAWHVFLQIKLIYGGLVLADYFLRWGKHYQKSFCLNSTLSLVSSYCEHHAATGSGPGAHRVQRSERHGWFCVCFWLFAASQSTHTHSPYNLKKKQQSAKNELQNWSSARPFHSLGTAANEPFHWRICGRNPFDHGLVVNDPGNTSSLTREREEKEKKDFPFVAAGGERTDRPNRAAERKVTDPFCHTGVVLHCRAINYPKDARAFHLTPLINHKFSALLAPSQGCCPCAWTRATKTRWDALFCCRVAIWISSAVCVESNDKSGHFMGLLTSRCFLGH